MDNFITTYKQSLIELINDTNNLEIENIIQYIDNTKGKIYIIGNGGSAATASHMANDLGIGLKRRNIKNYNVESLADNISIITAISNDIGYENIFYTQLQNKLTSNDLLIAISCSGNSPNILKAVEYANNIKTTVIGFTGFDGGKLKKLSDISLHINTQKGKYGLVEDIHMIINHIIFSYFVEKNNNGE